MSDAISAPSCTYTANIAFEPGFERIFSVAEKSGCFTFTVNDAVTPFLETAVIMAVPFPIASIVSPLILTTSGSDELIVIVSVWSLGKTVHSGTKEVPATTV